MPTICARCRHFIRDTERGDIWYGQFCGASKRPEVLNIITGHRTYGDHPWQTVTSDDKRAYRYARDVNDGNCPHYTDRNSR